MATPKSQMARPRAAGRTSQPALERRKYMSSRKKLWALWGVALLCGNVKAGSSDTAAPVLWREPADIASRNLLEGPGGKEHEPRPPFTFVKEDMEGSNPKFDVRDQDGVKWKVKLGAEARPETVATRLLWAIGYFTTEDYTLAEFRAQGMPAHLKRGEKFIGSDGSMQDARLKKNSEGEKKVGEWEWRNNPFNGTRE